MKPVFLQLVLFLLLPIFGFSQAVERLDVNFFCDDCDIRNYNTGFISKTLDDNLLFHTSWIEEHNSWPYQIEREVLNVELTNDGFSLHSLTNNSPRGKGLHLGTYNGSEIYSSYEQKPLVHSYDGQVLTDIALATAYTDTVTWYQSAVSSDRSSFVFAMVDSVSIWHPNGISTLAYDSARVGFIEGNYFSLSVEGPQGFVTLVYRIDQMTIVDTFDFAWPMLSPITGMPMRRVNDYIYEEWSESGVIQRDFSFLNSLYPDGNQVGDLVRFIKANNGAFYAYVIGNAGFWDGNSFTADSLSEYLLFRNGYVPALSYLWYVVDDNNNVIKSYNGQKWTLSPSLDYSSENIITRISTPRYWTTYGKHLYFVNDNKIFYSSDFKHIKLYREISSNQGSISPRDNNYFKVDKLGNFYWSNSSGLYKLKQDTLLRVASGSIKGFSLDTISHELAYISEDHRLFKVFTDSFKVEIGEAGKQYHNLDYDEFNNKLYVIEGDTSSSRLTVFSGTSISDSYTIPDSLVGHFSSFSFYAYNGGVLYPRMSWYFINGTFTVPDIFKSNSYWFNHYILTNEHGVIGSSDNVYYNVLQTPELMLRKGVYSNSSLTAYPQHTESYLYALNEGYPNKEYFTRYRHKSIVAELEFLDVGNYRIPVSANGFNGSLGRVKAEYPKNKGEGMLNFTHHQFSAQLPDSSLTPYFTGSYSEVGKSRGPLSSSASIGSTHGVFKVDRSMIEQHVNNHASAGYQMPKQIALWPAHGNTANGEATCLAPFEDNNNNGYYDPENGDVPFIKGDQAIYYISSSIQRNGSPGTYEIHTMFYGFNSVNPALNNTAFVDVRIINKGDQPFIEPAFAIQQRSIYRPSLIFNAPAYFDSDIGTDSLLQLAYTVSNPNGYDPNISLPALGFMGLNDTLDFNLPLGGNNIYDHTISGAEWVRSRHLGSWYPGFPLRYGYQILSPYDSSKAATNYVFTGDLATGTGWVPTHHTPDGKQIVSFVNPSLDPGDTLHIELAYINAFDSVNSRLESLALLRQYAQDLKTWYANNPPSDWPQVACTAPPVTGTSEVEQQDLADWKIYPNPAEGLVNVEWSGEQTQLTVFNITGQLMHSTTIQKGVTPVDISRLNKGIYLLRIQGSDATLKLVVR